MYCLSLSIYVYIYIYTYASNIRLVLWMHIYLFHTCFQMIESLWVAAWCVLYSNCACQVHLPFADPHLHIWNMFSIRWFTFTWMDDRMGWQKGYAGSQFPRYWVAPRLPECDKYNWKGLFWFPINPDLANWISTFGNCDPVVQAQMVPRLTPGFWWSPRLTCCGTHT